MKNYKNTDELLHLLCQIITKVNRTFVAKVEDDSHTNLYFDPLGKRVYGRWYKSNEKKYILAFNLDTFSFNLLNEQLSTEFTIHTAGKTVRIIEHELNDKFNSIGINTVELLDELHFEIPKYSFSDAAVQKVSSEDLNEWAHFRKLANHACSDLLGLAQKEADVRIWPHHFDTGIYFESNERISIGFGLAMQDKMVGSPYFYMSAYPKDFEIDYDLVNSNSGKWILSENWKGCVLSLEELEDLPYKEQFNSIRNYMFSTYNWFLKQ